MIGGKELDLHVLYSEVTRRGGHEKVKTWPFVFHFQKAFILRSGLILNSFHGGLGCRREEMEGSGKCFQVLSDDDECLICVEKALSKSSLPLRASLLV